MRSKRQLAKFLRVDHAGERAVQKNYSGQLAVLKNEPAAKEIKHMMAQKQLHIDAFDALLNKYLISPSLFYTFWGFAGFGLGMHLGP
tara:strand:+ start:199 stop:459 length:261 start_codon:yes stop_codon:yes gene_type:complete